MKSRKSKISLSLSLMTALVVMLGLSASPKKAWSIEPNECITPWGKNWHDELHLKNSEYLACHSCYDIIDPATNEGATNIPMTKKFVVSNVGLSSVTAAKDQEYRANANKFDVSWVMDMDESIPQCRNGITRECIDKQQTSFTFVGADIINPYVTTLTPFYQGSEMCFPGNPNYPASCPSDMPDFGMPTDTCELYDLFFGPGNCPENLQGFNPQTARYISFTGVLPPSRIEGVHYWRVFFTMAANGPTITSEVPVFMPDLIPGVPQESITDVTLTNFVRANN